MKTLLVILCLCVGVLSASWQDVGDPVLKSVPKHFRGVKLVETIDGLPEDIPNRYHTICTTDATITKWQFRKKGTTFVYLYGHKIKVHEDGICVMDVSFDQGIKTIQTEKKERGVKPYVSYFFMGKDEDDNGAPILVRLAFCSSLLGGNAFITFFRADDLEDWMSFRLE